MADPMTTTYMKDPVEWIAGYSCTAPSSPAVSITNINTAFPEISVTDATEAGTTAGDFANILYGILHETYEKFKGLTVEKPVNWVIYKQETLSTETEGESTVTFSVQFTTVTPAGQKNVKAEA